MFRSLYGKLALALLSLFLVIGVCFLIIVRFSTDLYYKEITQKLNSEIASYIVAAQQLISDGQVNENEMKDLATHVMRINPSAEVYLLDLDGNILGYSADPAKIKRTSVRTTPLEGLVAGDLDEVAASIVMGDDPRSLTGKKIFSVARVMEDGAPQGYLYVILGGEKHDSIAQMVQGSYIIKLSAWAVVASIVFAFVAGLFIFGALTRRLKRLTGAVEHFQQGKGGTLQPVRYEGGGRDEIDRLGHAFKDMSERIKDQVEALKETDRLRRELVTNVSHDLRTPLASMQGYIETVLIKGDSLEPDERQEYLEIAHKHGQQLGRLVEELFELAKLDAKNVKPRLESFSLAELAQDIVQKFELAASEKSISLSASLSPDAPFVVADICLIERVLENLIENALRHTPAGGHVALKLTAGEGNIKVSVEDTGTGIPAHHIPYIFDRFYRGDQVEANKTSHTGLGLAIVKRILELHRSTIRVESQVDEGTEFSFELPVGSGSDVAHV